jgi:hypothetical protein
MLHDARQVSNSSQGCGVLSQEAGSRAAGSRLARGVRGAAFGAFVLLGLASFAAGCAGDDNSGTGGNTGGAGGSGGSGGAGGSGGGLDQDSSTSCASRTDVDLYTANMTKKGKMGTHSFLLLQSDPAPPARGDNVWKVKITGPDGTPIGKAVTADISMPEHGHNTPIPPTLTFDAASGVWSINPVHFSMAGKWRIIFTARDPNDTALPLDSAEFNFCVE